MIHFKMLLFLTFFLISNGVIVVVHSSQTTRIQIKAKVADAQENFVENNADIVVTDSDDSLRISCTASCPVQWQLDKFMYAHFPDGLDKTISFENIRHVADYWNQSSYTYEAFIHMKHGPKQLTGRYICSCSDDPQIQSSVHVFWEGRGSSTFLLQEKEDVKIVLRKNETDWVTLFCGTSKPNVKLFLRKMPDNHVLTLSDSLVPTFEGFDLNTVNFPSAYGDYECSTDSSFRTVRSRYTVKNEFELDNIRRNSISNRHKVREQSNNSVTYEPLTRTIICCSDSSSSKRRQIGFFCKNPSQCTYKSIRLHFGEGNAHEIKDNHTCDSYTMQKPDPSNAVTFLCDLGNVESQAVMFFSLDEELLFNRDEANESNMIKLRQHHPIKEPYYVGTALEFSCTYSTYFFAKGIQWILDRGQGSRSTIINISQQKERIATKADGYVIEPGTNFTHGALYLKIRLYDTEIQKITCSVPLWSSRQWWNSSLLLHFSEPIPIKIKNGDDDDELFTSMGSQIELICQASGKPSPQFSWWKDGLMYPDEKIDTKQVDGWSKIVIKDVGEEDLGIYTCIVSNDAQEHSPQKKFFVRLSGYNNNEVIIISVTLCVITLLALAMVVLTRVVLVQRRKLKYLTEDEITEFERGNPAALSKLKNDVNSCAHLLPYNSEYEVAKETLDIDHSAILGQGAYGLVMKGTLRKNTVNLPVAVKMVKPGEQVEYFKILLSELKIMAFIGHHRNIVSLLGACSRNIRKKELLIAVEYCEHGNLQNFLKQSRLGFVNLFENFPGKAEHRPDDLRMSIIEMSPNVSTHPQITTAHLLRWSAEIATAMEFLSNKKVIHSDLATRNVLLAANLTAKVGDFGLSKFLFEYSTYVKTTKVALPYRWMAVESLLHMEFSVQSDIWSYGVTLWEIFTLSRTPYPGMGWDSNFLDKLERGSLRLSQPAFASNDVYNIMEKCWEKEPTDRPTFCQLKEQFQDLITRNGWIS